MIYTSLQLSGDLVALTVPMPVFEALRWLPNLMVSLSVQGNVLFVDPRPQRRFTLEELMGLERQDRPRGIEENGDWMTVLREREGAIVFFVPHAILAVALPFTPLQDGQEVGMVIADSRLEVHLRPHASVSKITARQND